MPFSLLSYHWEKNPISNKIFRILLAKIPLKWKSEIGQSTGDRDFKRESSPVLAFYKVFEPAPNKREPLHCRLRRSIGFLNVQKQMVVSHSRNSKIWKFCTFCEDYDPNFVPKKFIPFSESKYGQNNGQCSEKVERALSKGWIFVWWKYRPCQALNSDFYWGPLHGEIGLLK